MSNEGRCKSAKRDRLFMIYIASHKTNIYIYIYLETFIKFSLGFFLAQSSITLYDLKVPI